jgi:hypothetical protein
VNATTKLKLKALTSVGSVPFSMGRSVFLRAASTFMSATTLLAKLITKSIWDPYYGYLLGRRNSEEVE